MRKFLLHIVLFFIPVVIILVGAEVFVRSIPNSYMLKEQWIQRNGNTVKTLLLGNSHGYFALMPSAMGDSVFNLCNVSQRLEYDYFLLRHYAESCQNLKRVVLVADNSNLFDVPMEEDEPARVTYYQLYMGYRGHSMLSCYGFELANMTYAFQKVKSYFLEGDKFWCDSLGWGNGYLASMRNPDDFVYENIRQHHFANWESTRRNRDYMDSIAAWCQQHRIELLLLQTPVCGDYTRKAAPWQLRLVNAMVDSCCAQYGAQKRDYSCDPRFRDTDFFDSDHLSDQGARKFSAILAHDLLMVQR